MYNLIGQNFIDVIKSIVPAAKTAAGNTEIVVRCPFCGDSANQSHAHLYIKVPNDINELSLYHCKKCESKGLVNDEFLRKIGCYDSNILVAISQHNSEVLKLPQYKRMTQIDIYPLRNLYIKDNKFSRLKLDYINDRIGSKFTYNDLLKLKIFINLSDIVNLNKLELTRDINICEQLYTHFIGFISYDNSFATMRQVFNKNLIKSINKRYINYVLVNKNTDNKNFYVIPTSFDINQMVRIHIAEGVFDILSVYYNLNNANDFQNIYIASGGKSYLQALEFILKETGIINYEINIYPDSDVDDRQLNRLIINRIKLLPCDIVIHRNTYNNEKDFGVPKNRIVDSVRIIKENYYG